MSTPLRYHVRMNITGQRILISPNNKACQRTKNRIREHGKNGFIVEEAIICDHRPSDGAKTWLLRASDGWRGWLPKDEFHLECIGEEFFVEPFEKTKKPP